MGVLTNIEDRSGKLMLIGRGQFVSDGHWSSPLIPGETTISATTTVNKDNTTEQLLITKKLIAFKAPRNMTLYINVIASYTIGLFVSTGGLTVTLRTGIGLIVNGNVVSENTITYTNQTTTEANHRPLIVFSDIIDVKKGDLIYIAILGYSYFDGSSPDTYTVKIYHDPANQKPLIASYSIIEE